MRLVTVATELLARHPMAMLFVDGTGIGGPIIDRLNAEIKKALDTPEVSGRFNNIALNPMFSSPEQFAALLKSDYDRSAKLIAATGVKVN